MLCEGFLGYVQRRVFPGGCFFVATAAELGARRGRVHDRVAAYQREWHDLLEQTAGAGELADGADRPSWPSSCRPSWPGPTSWPSCTTTTAPSTAPGAPSRPGWRPR